MVGGIKGWKNKIRRREKEGKGFYREGKGTLKQRVTKKLLEKETWYKQKRRDDDDDEEFPTMGGIRVTITTWERGTRRDW